MQWTGYSFAMNMIAKTVFSAVQPKIWWVVGVFLCAQWASVAHSAEFGSGKHQHQHNGVECALSMQSSNQDDCVEPEVNQVVELPFVHYVQPSELPQFISAPTQRALNIRAPPLFVSFG